MLIPNGVNITGTSPQVIPIVVNNMGTFLSYSQ